MNNSLAGGFFAGTQGGSQSETPSGKKVDWTSCVKYFMGLIFFSNFLIIIIKQGGQRSQNVIPIMIKDVLASHDDKLKIEDFDVHMVCVYCITRNLFFMIKLILCR